MIYFICFLVGIINGFFASCAGQILIFYYIFIIKKDSYKSRAVSIAVLSLVSIITAFGYAKFVKYSILKIIIIAIISIISGFIGSKIMKKIPPDILNLISGISLVILTIIRIYKKRCLKCG